jgi:hypothetical protein
MELEGLDETELSHTSRLRARAVTALQQKRCTDVRYGSWLCENALLHVILAAVILALLRGIG